MSLMLVSAVVVRCVVMVVRCVVMVDLTGQDWRQHQFFDHRCVASVITEQFVAIRFSERKQLVECQQLVDTGRHLLHCFLEAVRFFAVGAVAMATWSCWRRGVVAYFATAMSGNDS